ncbi:MAG: amidohydrolase family protein [Clostridia bacterium]|nr:amidohydrolase family protein [Clostridia bacterium]
MTKSFVVKGNILYCEEMGKIKTEPNGYIVCIDGISKGVFSDIPEEYKDLELYDYTDKLIIPGLVDLHIHAPQFHQRGTGMDMELLDWLNKRTFKQESQFEDLEFADKAYTIFVDAMKKSATTRASMFATRHRPATLLLMEKLEESGLISYVGKLNMDRHCPDYLCETPEESVSETIRWVKECEKFERTKPILTPRFIPSCTDETMMNLGKIAREYNVPAQSHVSENLSEIKWVSELCPNSRFYGDAYNNFGLFGGDVKTIMAHCVWSCDEELEMMKSQGVFIAHSPQSNTNVSSGIAPIRRYIDMGLKVGLASDVAGGSSESIMRAMVDAVQVSKLRWRLVDQALPCLTIPEVFYMATKGGGEFFGKVGSFEQGYEFDAVVLDDSLIPCPIEMSLEDRLERMIYISDDRHIKAKFVFGEKLI